MMTIFLRCEGSVFHKKTAFKESCFLIGPNRCLMHCSGGCRLIQSTVHESVSWRFSPCCICPQSQLTLEEVSELGEVSLQLMLEEVSLSEDGDDQFVWLCE